MSVDKYLQLNKIETKGMRWFDPLEENVKFYGFNYLESDHIYNRLPKKYQSQIKETNERVYFLSSNTSGGQVHFKTNSTKLIIHAKVGNVSKLSGMTFVGQAGFDCYVGSDYDHLIFFESARFDIEKTEYEFTLFQGQPNNDKIVVINFPLYASVDFVLFAVDDGSYITSPSENLSQNGKIVYYGTSITQGGCASRPGLAYTNILSRRMKSEFINFGFSGNAFGENIFAKIMGEIEDATMFVIDYEANGGTNGKLELTLEDFINTLRRSHPTTPIVVISRIKYVFDELNNNLGKNRERIRQFQVKVVEKLKKNGDKHLYYINGSKLLGKDYYDCTIDTIHPNDYGFMMMANNLEKEFKKIIKGDKKGEER